jgi:hypothetical protein
MKLLIVLLPTLSCYFIPLMSKYSQSPDLKHPQSFAMLKYPNGRKLDFENWGFHGDEDFHYYLRKWTSYGYNVFKWFCLSFSLCENCWQPVVVLLDCHFPAAEQFYILWGLKVQVVAYGALVRCLPSGVFCKHYQFLYNTTCHTYTKRPGDDIWSCDGLFYSWDACSHVFFRPAVLIRLCLIFVIFVGL